MSIQVKDIIACLEQIAPQSLAESWDNIGLMCGHPDDVVTGVWLALTPTIDVLKRAHDHGANMIITHHPLIFKAMKSLREDDSPAKELTYLIRHNMILYSAHTNLDIAEGGVNDAFTKRLDLQNTEILCVTNGSDMFNLSVYVPKSHLVDIQKAMFSVGAHGQVANSCCGFVIDTSGFQAGKDVNPYSDDAQNGISTDDICLTFKVDAKDLEQVLHVLKSVHPYEKPIIDIIKSEIGGSSFGLGRIGDLPSPMSLGDVLQFTKHRLKTSALRYCGDVSKTIRKIAVMGGSGSGYIDLAKQRGADCYITGDLTYHHFQRGSEIDLALIDAGHFSTEKPVLYAIQQVLQNIFFHDIFFTVDESEADLIFYSNKEMTE